MQIYLVGGAVRDRLLGETVGERDWVVVGAVAGELEKLGYRRVGRSFPVFLHPQTGEEYALARTERKTGPGYRGFEVCADPGVTLEDDLLRRDLTINAMAEAADGTLVDPYGGQADLQARRLRHVSDAFREDPVRILRAARFAARFGNLGFHLDSSTLALMREMVTAGEADALVPERVWRETELALRTQHPEIYFEILFDCGALPIVFPELASAFDQAAGTAGNTALASLLAATRLTPAPEVRFAALIAGMDTSGHSGQGDHDLHRADLARALCQRVGAPNSYRELAVQVAGWQARCRQANRLSASQLLELLEAIDVFRRPERFDDFLLACEAVHRGYNGEDAFPQSDWLRTARDAAAAVQPADLMAKGFSGPQLGDAIRAARCEAIAGALAS